VRIARLHPIITIAEAAAKIARNWSRLYATDMDHDAVRRGIEGLHVDRHVFSTEDGDGECLPVPTPDAVTELIFALSICATSLDQLADEVVQCALHSNDAVARQDLLAAARGQRIRVLEVQGMLAALSGALIERHVADKRP
jgi:hypothetical protein